MNEWLLSANATRSMVALQQLLKKDHQVSIGLSEDNVIEQLFDATRKSRDNKADFLAQQICGELKKLNSASVLTHLCKRLKENFSSTRIEAVGGVGAKQMYRGQVVETREAKPVEVSETTTEGEAKSKRMYRGQEID